MISHHAIESEQQERILVCLEEGIRHWSRYQDGIARACGLRPS